MSTIDALIILFVCTVLAIAVCAPVIVISRRLKRRCAVRVRSPAGTRLSSMEIISGLMLVFVLFLAFAQQYIAPGSWLGARVATDEGRFWFTVLVVLVAGASTCLGAGLTARRAKSRRPNSDR